MSGRDRHTRTAAAAGLVLVVSVALSGCAQDDRAEGADATSSMQSWAHSYPTLAEMAEASDLVARTTVVAVQGWESPEGGASWTEYRVRLDQPVKPSTGAPTEVVVKQTGAAEDPWPSSVVLGDPLMVVGDEAVLFLTAHDGGYHVSGGPTGRIAIDGEALTYLPESSLEERPDDATDLLARVAALG